MEKIFLKLKTPVAVILLLILAGGAFSYKNLKTSLFPNVTFPKIKIIADNGEQPVDKMMIEVTKPIEDAIKREKQLKKWNRTWKIELIEKDNSTWHDLFYDIE